MDLKDLFIGTVSDFPAKMIEKEEIIYKLVSASFQGFKRLLVSAYAIAGGAANDEAGIKYNNKYLLPWREINNYNVLIDGRNFYDQPVNDLIKQYDEVRKVSTGQGDV